MHVCMEQLIHHVDKCNASFMKQQGINAVLSAITDNTE